MIIPEGVVGALYKDVEAVGILRVRGWSCTGRSLAADRVPGVPGGPSIRGSPRPDDAVAAADKDVDRARRP